MSNDESTRSAFEMIFKIVIVGDASVGKSKMVVRYLKNEFESDSQSTIGVELNSKEYTLDWNKIKVQIWDTAGQDKYRSMSSAYYKGAQGFILVYDITNRQSFDNVETWYSTLKSNLEFSTDLDIILIGNKCDLEQNRKVTKEEGEDKAKILNVPFMETSSLNGTNIVAAFNKLVYNVYERNKKMLNPEIKLSLDAKKEKKQTTIGAFAK